MTSELEQHGSCVDSGNDGEGTDPKPVQHAPLCDFVVVLQKWHGSVLNRNMLQIDFNSPHLLEQSACRQSSRAAQRSVAGFAT